MRENCIHLALYKLTSSRLHFLSYTGEKKKKNLNPPGKKRNWILTSRTENVSHPEQHFRNMWPVTSVSNYNYVMTRGLCIFLRIKFIFQRYNICVSLLELLNCSTTQSLINKIKIYWQSIIYLSSTYFTSLIII